jgi:hypothetical protein
MRTLIMEPDSKRFRISQEDLPVVDELLIFISNLQSLTTQNATHLTVSNLTHKDGSDVFTYSIQFDHFKIT